MNTELNNSEEQQSHSPLRHHRRGLSPITDEGRTYALRQWLNVLFLLGAIVGLIVWFSSAAYRDTAIYILIGASILKFIELSLRILKL